MKRLALLHTVLFLADFFKTRLNERLPDLKTFNIVDESLLQDLLADGGLTPKVVRRVVGHALSAQEAGADRILFTCSSTSPAVNVARQLVDIPIMKIDDPMADRAVDLGRRIGVVCTANSTVDASRDLILQHAGRKQKEVEVAVHLEDEAFQAVMAGDKNRHDQLVAEAVRRLAPENDVIVLAQASMAHLAPALDEELDAAVLASPEPCLNALAEL